MADDAPAPAADLIHPIEYQQMAGNRYNLDLRGKGTLVVRADRSVFAFSGVERGNFIPYREITLELRADQIRNVVQHGRQVQFLSAAGRSASQNKPFVFFCSSPEDAAAVVAQLPAARDADFFAGRDFAEKLRQLSGPGRPWTSVTNLLIAANVAVFVVMGFLGAGWIEVAGMEPYIRYGANNGGVTTDGEWWRLVTSMFLHYGLLHLALNMWALFQAGHLVERLFGRPLYTLAYFGSGIAGSLTTLIWNGDRVWSAGASGAIFGVFGALLGYMLREKHGLPKVVYQPMMKSTLSFAGYNLLFGVIVPGIDMSAHIGGFAGGIVLGWLIALPLEAEVRARLQPRRLMLGLAAVAASVAAGVALAPRFDYRLTDEIAWQKVNAEPAAKETGVAQHLRTATEKLGTDPKGRELIRVLTDEAIPFYDGWRRQLAALPLAPGRRTERRRDALVKIIDLKVTSYRHLAAGLEAGESDALARFQNEQQAINQELQTLAAVK